MAMKLHKIEYMQCVYNNVCMYFCIMSNPWTYSSLPSKVLPNKMPLHKYPPKIWEALKLQTGIYSRLPQHYLRSMQDTTPATPVHWKPLGVKYRPNPKSGHKERVQDVPIPVYYPPESQDGLWGGEGWISGFRYAKGDKVRLKRELLEYEFNVNRGYYKLECNLKTGDLPHIFYFIV